MLMDNPTLDREYEAADMPEKIKAYKRQITSGQFSQDVLSDAQELLAPLLPAGDKADLGALRHASRGVLRARSEQKRRLITDLTGDYAASENSDPLFSGMSATDYPTLMVRPPPLRLKHCNQLQLGIVLSKKYAGMLQKHWPTSTLQCVFLTR